MQKAKQFSLEGLLYNPQTLDMLISAVQGNKWPNTKLETYELACQKMAVEHSDEHKASHNKKSISEEQLLEAAGFLCATLLLANASEFNKSEDASEEQVGLSAIKIPDELPCRQVLKSRLFKCTGGKLYTPIHRSVAEFLGARFLAKTINEGLPLSRVLALMTGFDGGVVAALRGLTSWLGVHSPEARNHLIGIDPLGMVIYGDVQLFATQTKQQLLFALRHEAENNGYLQYGYWVNYPFAALTTKDMANQLLDLLTSSSRKNHDHHILNCILDGLQCSSEVIPELKEPLLSIVRDKTYWEGIRIGALQAYIHQHSEDVGSLLMLAEDVRLNKIEDDNNRLLNMLLTKLFPKTINANKIFDYLRLSKASRDNHIVTDLFWDGEFLENTVDQDLPVLLDELTKRKMTFSRQSQGQNLFSMVGQLLVRGLEIFGETISDDRLYDWLSLGLDEYQHSRLKGDNYEKIQVWLKNHPDLHLALISEGLNRIKEPKKIHLEIYKVNARLYSAPVPDNLGLWWLDHALEVDTKIKKDIFREAWWSLINRRGHKGLSLEFFQNWVEQHPEFKDIYQASLVCDIDERRKDHAQSEKKWTLKREQEKATRLKYIRENLTAIQDGSVYPQVLHNLAAAYFNHYSNINGETGIERLAEFLDHDEDLINSVNKGMCKIFERPDLPQTSEMFSLAAENREHYIRLPFLVCMDYLYQKNPSMLDSLSDGLATKALAFWYTYGAGSELMWVRPLILSRPALTAKVLIEYVSAMLTAKVQHIHGIYQLLHDPEYQEITKLAAIPLLEIYPVRANKQQASTLEYLLKAAIENGDRSRLLELITEKLALKSLNVAQRVYWLATGLLLDPSQYEPVVRKYVNNNVTRINHLSAFLYSGLHTKQPSFHLPPNIISLIAELLTPRSTPYWPNRKDSRVTRSMHEGDYVRSLLNRLSENPDVESAQVIEHLLSLPQISVWHEHLRNIRQSQQIRRREALFQYPSATAVAYTLNNLKPANVADLAGLVMDILNKLSAEMRAIDTDNYKRFWNENSYTNPNKPKAENSCRDYLVEKLRAQLSILDIEIQPETHEANDKRADMRLPFKSNGNAYHLPVEIKLDHSQDLWRAIHEQLIPLYTLDPETQGRGIFLVIWFGVKSMPAPDTGKKPKTTSELEARLIETLTPQEQKLIDVFVLDVSKQPA